MIKLLPLIVLLVLSLTAQNSCPFGAAGKTSIAHSCAHCPLMRHCAEPANGQKRFTADSATAHFPLFIFAVSRLIAVFHVETTQGDAPQLALACMDSFPMKLLKPPQA